MHKSWHMLLFWQWSWQQMHSHPPPPPCWLFKLSPVTLEVLNCIEAATSSGKNPWEPVKRAHADYSTCWCSSLFLLSISFLVEMMLSMQWKSSKSPGKLRAFSITQPPVVLDWIWRTLMQHNGGQCPEAFMLLFAGHVCGGWKQWPQQ